MNRTLFAYGTLQHPKIISFVLKRVPEAAPAKLKNYARYAIQDADYPGIIPESGAETNGTAFYNISPDEWQKLDSYESDLYDRQSVTMLMNDGSSETAEAYIIPANHQHVLSNNLWELKKYRPNPLP